MAAALWLEAQEKAQKCIMTQCDFEKRLSRGLICVTKELDALVHQ